MLISINESITVAEQKQDGWYIGRLGPFQTIDTAISATDGVCAIVSRKGDWRSNIVIDGEFAKDDRGEPLAFNGCTFVRTASGRLLIRAWRPEPDKPQGQGERHEFFVTKKSVHGPFVGTHPISDFYAGAFSMSSPGEQGYMRHVLYEHEFHGPFGEIDQFVDAADARYLLCSVDRKKHGRVFVIAKRGLLGGYDAVDTDSKKAIVARPSALRSEHHVIFGGRVLNALAEASTMQILKVGRNLLQHVWFTDAAGKRRETLHFNGRQLAGPFDSIGNLAISDEGRLTYTAIDTDGLGVSRLRISGGTLPTDL